jgi:muramoyltetrapeptide carboxypeptidase LdcA involved in peptidoglycan recycling
MHIPPKLNAGDEIRVLALSRSLGGVMQPGGFTEGDVQFAAGRLESLGLERIAYDCIHESRGMMGTEVWHGSLLSGPA